MYIKKTFYVYSSFQILIFMAGKQNKKQSQMFLSTIAQRTYKWAKRRLETVCGFPLLAGIIAVFIAVLILNKPSVLINYFLQQNYYGIVSDNKPKPVQPQYTHG